MTTKEERIVHVALNTIPINSEVTFCVGDKRYHFIFLRDAWYVKGIPTVDDLTLVDAIERINSYYIKGDTI